VLVDVVTGPFPLWEQVVVKVVVVVGVPGNMCPFELSAIALEVVRGYVANAAVAAIMVSAVITVFVSIKNYVKMFYTKIIRYFLEKSRIVFLAII